MDLNAMQEKRRRWSMQYQAQEQWTDSTRDAASELIAPEEAAAAVPSFGTSSAVDALLQGDAYPPPPPSYQSDTYSRSHQRDLHLPPPSSYHSDPYAPQPSSALPPPSGYSAPSACGYSRPSSSRTLDAATDLFDVREDNGDEDDGFEQQMAAAEAQYSAPAAPAVRSPVYFRSRKEAAAVLLRNSHFSSGSKLFSGGAIAVRVSRVSVRDATRDAEAVAQGVRLELALFGKPVRSFDVDLSGREAREGMHGGAEAVLDAALCHEEDPAVLAQLLMSSPLCQFQLLSPGAQPRLLASAAIDLAAMSHDIATITLPLVRPGDVGSQLLGEITCSITAGMPRHHGARHPHGVLAPSRSHSRPRSLPRSDGTMAHGGVGRGASSPHSGSRHRLHGSRPAAATTLPRPLSAGPRPHNAAAIGAPVLGPSLASLADRLDARAGRAPGGRARPQSAGRVQSAGRIRSPPRRTSHQSAGRVQSAGAVRGVPASALSAAAGYAAKAGRQKPGAAKPARAAADVSASGLAGEDLRRAADEAEELAIAVHAAPSYPASAPPTLSHGEAEPYWNAWRLSRLPKGRPAPGEFILLAEVRHARSIDVGETRRRGGAPWEGQARSEARSRVGQDNPNKKKEPATPTYHMAQMTTKHKGEKYAEYLQQVRGVVQAELGSACEVLVVPGEQDTHVWRARHDSADKFRPGWRTPRMARLGAFELQLVWCEGGHVVSELLHSKLGTLRWPSMARLAASLQRIQKYANEPKPSSYDPSDPYPPQPSSHHPRGRDPPPDLRQDQRIYSDDAPAPHPRGPDPPRDLRQDQRIYSDDAPAPPARAYTDDAVAPPAHARVEYAPARAPPPPRQAPRVEYTPAARTQPPTRPSYEPAGGGGNYDNYGLGDDSDVGDQGFSGDEGDY